MKTLSNAAEIIEVLGGPHAVAALTRVKNVKVVWNWHGYFRAFPSNTYKVMIDELERLGYTASPALWRMKGFTKRTTKRAA
jgi:hypothetical protein